MKRKNDRPRVLLPDPILKQVSKPPGFKRKGRRTSASADANLLLREDLERDVLEHGRQLGRVRRREALDLDTAVPGWPNRRWHYASLALLIQLEVCPVRQPNSLKSEDGKD